MRPALTHTFRHDNRAYTVAHFYNPPSARSLLGLSQEDGADMALTMSKIGNVDMSFSGRHTAGNGYRLEVTTDISKNMPLRIVGSIGDFAESVVNYFWPDTPDSPPVALAPTPGNALGLHIDEQPEVRPAATNSESTLGNCVRYLARFVDFAVFLAVAPFRWVFQ